ncbi:MULTISPECIES: ABC transporter substrate-binding protein [Ramlibacter]|uniref:ABC transporter substrate-binding protein n=1 Tax=Ramlibacter aquaticus TaxID=2780094 RepID=A0ABR9SFK8_9BURK|nr:MULTISPECIES: ABC transporter substrate-binding protein [Ramlibacter]MBE7941103.1 ABC transporter substrate-binding protein [Ramlibacter aquaticus]
MQGWKTAALALTIAAACLPAARAELLIGQTAGFTGPVAGSVKETAEGARLYIDQVNARGGVAGEKIDLIAMDDGFEVKRTAENARILIEDKKVLALFLVRGTPNNEAILPMLEQSGTVLVAPSTGAMLLHDPVKREVFNVRAPYQKESEKAVVHLSTIGMTRIAVVHADDSFGADGVAGADKGFAKAGIKPVAVIKADRLKPDFAGIVKAIVGANAQAVVWIGSGTAVADGVKALRKAGSAAQVVTLSNNASSGFIKSLGEDSRGVIVTQVFPDERQLSYAFIAEATALAKAKGLKEVTPAMLEGFASAKVLVEGLRRASPHPTREKLRAALESMRDFDLGGLRMGYGPNDHTGLEFADLSIIGPNGHFRR